MLHEQKKNSSNNIKTPITIFIFQSLMMESLDQLSSSNLEVMEVEKGSINSSVMNIDRNKIEAIPKTNQVLTIHLKIEIINNMQMYVYFL